MPRGRTNERGPVMRASTGVDLGESSREGNGVGSDGEARAAGRPGVTARPRVGESLSSTPLRELLAEVEDRIEGIVAGTRERMDALLDAVLAVSSGLELDTTLRHDRAGGDGSGRVPGTARWGCWVRAGCC